MTNAAQWVAAAASLIVALLLHTFYIDYRADASVYLISWPATSAQREMITHSLAIERVRPERVEHVLPNISIDPFVAETAHIEKYCTPTEHYSRQASASKLFFSRNANDKKYFRCSKPFIPTKVEWKKLVTPAVTYATARKSAASEIAKKSILFGMVPSSVVAGTKPSRTAFVKSYWLGVILPFALVAVAALVFVVAWRGRKATKLLVEHESMVKREEPTGPVSRQLWPANTAMDGGESLADLIRSELGSDFPISTGTGKEDNPIVITATTDYVAVEYAVARHVLGMLGEDYKLSKQSMSNNNGRMIDELIFDAKKTGDEEWSGVRRFYFDITVGFEAARR